MLFIEPVYVLTTWYMPVILGIYIFIPYISRALKSMDHLELLPLLLVTYVYFFIVPTIYHLKADQAQIPTVLDLNFSGGLYGFYVVLGYLIRVYSQYLSKLSVRTSVMIILIGIALITQVQIWVTDKILYCVWYDFFLQPIVTVLIFHCLQYIKFNRFSELILKISNCSFGMYLFHIIVIFALFKYDLLNFIAIEEIRITIAFILTFILSFSSIMLIRRLPYLGKILVR